MSVLLDVRGLTTRFRTENGTVHAVNGISYRLEGGESIAIVGESGSGKSVGMLSIMGLVPSPPGWIEAGEVLFKGRDLLALGPEELRRIRGNDIAMVFQDPMTSLNPVLSIGLQLTEAIAEHQSLGRRAALERAVEYLELVGLPKEDVFFFQQEMVPSCDFEGHLMLAEPDRIFENPNGHLPATISHAPHCVTQDDVNRRISPPRSATVRRPRARRAAGHHPMNDGKCLPDTQRNAPWDGVRRWSDRSPFREARDTSLLVPR